MDARRLKMDSRGTPDPLQIWAIRAIRAIRETMYIRPIRTIRAIRKERSNSAIKETRSIRAVMAISAIRRIRESRAIRAIRVIRAIREIRTIRVIRAIRKMRAVRPIRVIPTSVGCASLMYLIVYLSEYPIKCKSVKSGVVLLGESAQLAAVLLILLGYSSLELLPRWLPSSYCLVL